MSTLVYMKLLEQTPDSYDRGMRILTVGRIDLIKDRIAQHWVGAGDSVLEIGCGAGTLAAMLVARGAEVVGIDISDAMLATARINAPGADFLHLTATEIDALGRERFDRIVATLSLSELTQPELKLWLTLAAAALKPRGTIIIADEIRQLQWWRRGLAACVRWPLAALTFVLTRSSTRALSGLEPGLTRVGLQVQHRESHLLGTLALIVARKEQ